MRRTLLDQGLIFPEGPRWHQDSLYFSDQHAHKVLRLTLDGAKSVVAEFDDMPSGLGFLPDGRLLVALMRTAQLTVVDTSSGTHVKYADLSGSGPRCLVNDIVVGVDGTAYVGCRTGSYAHPPEGPGWITAVTTSGELQIVADELMGPNGMVLHDDKILIAETWEGRLTEFVVRPTGRLAERRTFAQLPDGMRPDGICFDRDGAVWAGAGAAWVRIADGGAVLDSLPPRAGYHSVACVLGGPNRDVLLMLSNNATREGLQSLAQGTPDSQSGSAGQIEAADIAVPGAGIP